MRSRCVIPAAVVVLALPLLVAACGETTTAECRKPLRLDQDRRIQHGRAAHARRRPSCSGRRTRTSGSRSGSPAPAAASRSSAPARPTSPTPRGRSSPRRSTACKKEGVAYGEAQVANDGLAVVVNPENDWADCLTTAELKKIWEPGSEGQQLEPGQEQLPGREDGAVRRRHRLGHVRVLHRGRSTAKGRDPQGLQPLRGRQRHGPGRVGRQGQHGLLRPVLRDREQGQGEDGPGGRRRRLRRARPPRRSRTAATSRCRGRCSSTRRRRPCRTRRPPSS